MQLNESQKAALLSALRSVLATVGGILVANGTINESTLNTCLGLVTVLVPTFWGIIEKYRAESRTQTRIDVAVNNALDATNTGAPR